MIIISNTKKSCFQKNVIQTLCWISRWQRRKRFRENPKILFGIYRTRKRFLLVRIFKGLWRKDFLRIISLVKKAQSGRSEGRSKKKQEKRINKIIENVVVPYIKEFPQDAKITIDSQMLRQLKGQGDSWNRSVFTDFAYLRFFLSRRRPSASRNNKLVRQNRACLNVAIADKVSRSTGKVLLFSE